MFHASRAVSSPVGQTVSGRAKDPSFVLHFVRNAEIVRTHGIRASRFTIGTAEDCTVRAHSSRLAPCHATILLVDGEPTIFASPGLSVVVNGQPVYQASLRPEDLVQIGPISFHLEHRRRVAGPPAVPLPAHRR